MPNLESLANLGEIIGAIAVVVSLIYLAVQVRQNTQAQRTENFARALDRVAAMQASLTQDAQTTAVFSRAVETPSELTPKERIQFTWAMYELFGALEFMFMASKTKAIPKEIWQRWSAATSWWLSFPGVQQWWNARPIPFTQSFTVFVEDLLVHNPTDNTTKKRFGEFVAGA